MIMKYKVQTKRYDQGGNPVEWHIAPDGYGCMPKNKRRNIRRKVKKAFGHILFFNKPEQSEIDKRLS